MILKTLVENTSSSREYKSKHGICFYIETSMHKILFDLGKDGLFLENAKKMGIDIKEIDTVIISHGHTDHGGALALFLENNNMAKVYVRENAFDEHYTKVLGLKINVGIDDKLKHHQQIILTGENTNIDKELLIFSGVKERELYSSANNKLFMKKDDIFEVDDFSHEQSLIIDEGGHKILVAGCSHSGIVNIKNKAEEIINQKLTHVISGFHLYNPISNKRESDILVREIGDRLKDDETYYYTCHCTGDNAFNILKETLGNRLMYLSTGSVLEI